jgi:hypothetical protein
MPIIGPPSVFLIREPYGTLQDFFGYAYYTSRTPIKTREVRPLSAKLLGRKLSDHTENMVLAI